MIGFHLSIYPSIINMHPSLKLLHLEGNLLTNEVDVNEFLQSYFEHFSFMSFK